MFLRSKIFVLWYYQVRVYASDKGEPDARTIEGRLTVFIDRNRFPPEILNLFAEDSIQENAQVNSNVPVFTVEVRDSDTVVCNIVKLVLTIPY